MCDHLFDTTSRYDIERKLLTFLLFCPECGTETVVERLRYEPVYRADPAGPAGLHLRSRTPGAAGNSSAR